MKRILYISILILATSFMCQAQKIEFQKVSAKEFHSLIVNEKNHLIIDVSRKIDHLDGHIKGAVFAETSEKLFSILDTTPNCKSILIYCKYGRRCQKASWLIAEKYPHKVFSLKKGMEDWIAKGFKLINENDSSSIQNL